MVEKMDGSGVKQETLIAFDAMWGLHPSPVLLIMANRDIVAVNEAGNKLGVKPGTKCFQLSGNERICDGCQGNAALKERTAKRAAAWHAKLNLFMDTYWIPVRGQEGLYVHFFNDLTPYAKEALCK